MKTSELPAWYLEESGPRLKRIYELSPIAHPNGSDEEPMPTTLEEVRAMHEARREWEELVRAQMAAEVAAGL
jgi:hypothetical protein